MSTDGADTVVVHLVWAPLGPQTLARFLDSYRLHDAGAPHRLVVLLNGFRSDDELGPWRELLAGMQHEELRLERPLLDLAAYREAALRIQARRYCFVNSHSVVRAAGWLAALERALGRPGVGTAGASGSWGSRASHDRYSNGLGGPHAAIFDDLRSTNEVFAQLTADDQQPSASEGYLTLRWRAAANLARNLAGFTSFPAPHLRTNCFLIDRALWLRVSKPAPANKLAAYRLESGRRSITNKLRRMGLRVIVVGRDGGEFEPQDWPESDTFWQGAQQNLLVSDNQTSTYERGGAQTRLVLSRYAWGPRAAPTTAQPNR